MLTVNKLISQARGLAPVLLKRAATVELDWDVRQKSRFDAADSQGRTLGVFLPRGTVARGGDVLVAEDGSLIAVKAAPQPVLVVRHCSDHGSPFDLLRAAYHLGNRHVALELKPDHIKLEPDHVLADMLRQMHLIVTEANESFEPENGAYGAESTGGHGHSHDHAGHGHDHAGHAHEGHDHGAHDHGSHGHDHAGHGHAHAHDHDTHSHAAHGHDHDHKHGHAHGHGDHTATTPVAPTARRVDIPIKAKPSHDHAHDHGHDHAHGGHVHGPDCKHDH